MAENLFGCFNSDDSFRYLLGEYTKQDEKLIVCIGVNPSTATTEKLDSTLTRLNKYCKEKSKLKCKWVMINLYAQKATNPNELDYDSTMQHQEENIKAIKNFLLKHKKENTIILAAWGNLITKRSYLITCLKEIYDVAKDYEWKCIKTTAKGHPKHWIGASYPKALQEFDVVNYITKFSK